MSDTIEKSILVAPLARLHLFTKMLCQHMEIDASEIVLNVNATATHKETGEKRELDAVTISLQDVFDEIEALPEDVMGELVDVNNMGDGTFETEVEA